MSIQTSARPVMTSVPAIACTIPCAVAAATSTRCRGSRSAHTPAATVIAAAAACLAAMTSPSDVAEPPMWSTANASATVVTPSPSAEIDVLEKTRRKLRSASAPRRPRNSTPENYSPGRTRPVVLALIVLALVALGRSILRRTSAAA